MKSGTNRNAVLLITVLLMILCGCSSAPDISNENALAESGQSIAAFAETPIPTIGPTSEPTPSPTPVPTQYPQPDPIPPEAANAQDALAAYEIAKAYLSENMFLTDQYETVFLDKYLSYDETLDQINVDASQGAGDMILRAIQPLLTGGRVKNLGVTLGDSGAITLSPNGCASLWMDRWNDSGELAWLQGCDSIISLQVEKMDVAEYYKYFPPALKELTILDMTDSYFDFASFSGQGEDSALPQLTALTIGSEQAPLEIDVISSGEDIKCFPKLANLNLWVLPSSETGKIVDEARGTAGIKNINGVAKASIGQFFGYDMESIQDKISEQVSSVLEGTGKVTAASGLPASINGPVCFILGEASNWNYEDDESPDEPDKALAEGFYGIPPQMLWEEAEDDANAYLIYIYEYDSITGYYGDLDWEDWGYAVETRCIVVEVSTGKAWQKTICRTNPPNTNEFNTYGEYCPLRAVNEIRKLIRSQYGPYAGCDISEATETVAYRIAAGDPVYATQGLPASLTGVIQVTFYYEWGNCSEDESFDDSINYAGDEEDYYGIPLDRVQTAGEEDAAYAAVICECDNMNKTYTNNDYYDEGYTVETHLIIVEMATGKAWHKLIKSSAPPSNPEETNYGSFYPSLALDALRKLIK